MPQSLLTGQLKEKPTYRVWCLYSSFVHDLNHIKYGKDDSLLETHFQGLKYNTGSYLDPEVFIFVWLFEFYLVTQSL